MIDQLNHRVDYSDKIIEKLKDKWTNQEDRFSEEARSYANMQKKNFNGGGKPSKRKEEGDSNPMNGVTASGCET